MSASTRARAPFVSVRDTAPEYLPMTEAEQDAFGERMGHDILRWRDLQKRPVLCIPNTPRCAAWLEWAQANNALPPGAGFMMMHSNVYTERFMVGAMGHSAKDQEDHVIAHGRPMVNWQFVVGVIEP